MILRVPKLSDYNIPDDWFRLGDDVPNEFANDGIRMMALPDRRHQEISGEIFRQFANFLDDKIGKVYHAPFEVRLLKDTVFLPDLVVVCDPSKLNDKGCEGAPDLVVEILSPVTSRYDRFTKFHEYLRAGVMEYWIADPVDKTVTAHRMKDGAYITDVYGEVDHAPVLALPGCEIDLLAVFGDENDSRYCKQLKSML